jgi:hypothetical protein
MFSTFGWKAIIVVLVNTLVATFVFRRELSEIHFDKESQEKLRTWWDDGDSKLKKSLYIFLCLQILLGIIWFIEYIFI